MLGSIKRLLSRPASGRELKGIEEWARRRGHAFKRVRDEDGFVIDGQLEGRSWRIEWGPSHRDYIVGQELRLRMELDLPSDAQMLVLSRTLMDSLERQAFEEFTDGVLTQIGAKTPEEMRWLVMFPKLNLAHLKGMRARFGAVASAPAAGLLWIEGPLANLLEQAANQWLSEDKPFVLMTLRGRTYLRMPLATPDAAVVADALALFETAVTQAGRAVDGMSDPGTDSGRSTAWQTLSPDDKP